MVSGRIHSNSWQGNGHQWPFPQRVPKRWFSQGQNRWRSRFRQQSVPRQARNLHIVVATCGAYIRAAARVSKKIDGKIKVVVGRCYKRAHKARKKRHRRWSRESTPDNRIVRRQQVKEGLVAIGLGSDSQEMLEDVFGGSPTRYGIDTLCERPGLMVTIHQQDERPTGLSLDFL